MISIEYILLGAAVLLLLGIVGSKASSVLGLPALLIFLLLGMLAGSEGFGGIYFDDPWMAQFVGVIALVFILFAGGLDTDWKTVRPVLWKGLSLSTIGVLVTAISVGVCASLVTGFSLLEGLLLGAIVSSTDAAAVFSMLRAKNVSLKGQLTPLLELESGSNDPMAVFLTVGMITLVLGTGNGLLSLLPLFVIQMAFGCIAGLLAGYGTVHLINHVRLHFEGLYSVVTIAMVMLTYGVATALGGNGFLAVYLAGLVMGNSDFIHKRSLIRFHDGLAWLMQIAMFLVLGLLVFPSRLLPVIGEGLLIALFLIIVARPLGVHIALIFFPISWREKSMVTWVGLRGAVPIVLATFPLLAGVPHADMIFNIVFFIVLSSIVLQGTSLPLVARWLKVDAPLSQRARCPLELMPIEGSDTELVRVEVPADSRVVGLQVVEVGFPKDVLVSLVNRRGEYIVPYGGTVLEAGDILLLLGGRQSLEMIQQKIRSSNQGKGVTKEPSG